MILPQAGAVARGAVVVREREASHWVETQRDAGSKRSRSLTATAGEHARSAETEQGEAAWLGNHGRCPCGLHAAEAG